MLRNRACLAPTAENLCFPPQRGDYVYFEAPRLAPGEVALVDAAWAADAAMLAYARYGRTRMQATEFADILHQAGFGSVHTFGDCFVDNACTARGFFATGTSQDKTERALLAFRGTEQDNFYDLATDADLLLVKSSGARVHQGFLRYFHSVWWHVSRLVADWRQDHPAAEICITGHSLGAAMATLAFAYLQDPATSLYTFACPRVGDQAFCDQVATAARERPCYRVVNNQDIVTHLPLHTFGYGYTHPEIPVLWLDPAGQLITHRPSPPNDWTDLAYMALGSVNRQLPWLFSKSLPRPLADHSPVRYCHWLGEAVLTQART